VPQLNRNKKIPVRLTLNGQLVEGEAAPRMLLSDFLRHVVGVTGTHVGCEHGVCGACTVHVNGRVARACLMLAVQAEGLRIDTIEAQAESDGTLGIIQSAFKRNFALQCGFCTPGIVMSLADYLEHGGTANETDINKLLGGHLCRCTGYTPIIKASMEAATEFGKRNSSTTVESLAGDHSAG